MATQVTPYKEGAGKDVEKNIPYYMIRKENNSENNSENNDEIMNEVMDAAPFTEYSAENCMLATMAERERKNIYKNQGEQLQEGEEVDENARTQSEELHESTSRFSEEDEPFSDVLRVIWTENGYHVEERAACDNCDYENNLCVCPWK